MHHRLIDDHAVVLEDHHEVWLLIVFLVGFMCRGLA